MPAILAFLNELYIMFVYAHGPKFYNETGMECMALHTCFIL